MDDRLRVRLAATPPLFHELVARTLDGEGVVVTTSEPSLISVVTPDQAASTHSKIVIVLGDSFGGDVRILVEGKPAEKRVLEASQLRQLVLDLAQPLRHDALPLRAPSTPRSTSVATTE